MFGLAVLEREKLRGGGIPRLVQGRGGIAVEPLFIIEEGSIGKYSRANGRPARAIR